MGVCDIHITTRRLYEVTLAENAKLAGNLGYESYSPPQFQKPQDGKL